MIVNLSNIRYHVNMRKIFAGLTIFILFISVFGISPKVYAAENEESAFQIIMDLFKKILDIGNAPPASTYGGGDTGGGGSARNKYSPLPNMTGEVVEQDKILAEQMLNNPSIDLTCLPTSCNTDSRQVVTALQSGAAPTICSGNDCGSCAAGGTGGNVTMNPKVLQGLLELSKTYSFCVTTLTNGLHSSSTSTHFSGNAADLDISKFSSYEQQQIRAQLNSYCGRAICEDDSYDDDPSCSMNNHIHWTCN